MGAKTKFKTFPKTGKTKGKRWKKGHSSSSNPETKRFREAAKNRFFSPSQPQGASGLTVDALAKHDEEHTEVDAQSMAAESDRNTLGGGTFKTWATNWTECTNVTFNKVHRYWTSNSALHKEILAVLAAITEVIKTEGGTETETEYFAALMTALETCEEEQSMSAILYLISLVIKRVPVTVLRNKFSEVSKCFLDHLSKLAETESPSLLKSLLTCLAFLLRAQDHGAWKNSSTQHVFKGLLTFITYRKPRVRKAAHQGVSIVLKGSLFMLEDSSPSHHPAASLTTKHCIQEIENCGGTGEATETLYTLSLLRSILPVLPDNSVKSVCETILRVMTLGNVMVTSCGMQALHSLFSAKPKVTTLSVELNAQLITALYDYQPSLNDVQPMKAWLAVMETAHTNLSSIDEKLGLSHLPRLFSTCMLNLMSEKTDIAKAATKAMNTVLQECIRPAGESIGVLINTTREGTPVHKIVKALESGLSYQFHAAWDKVLLIFATLYEVLGKHCPSLLLKSLTGIAELRDSHRFTYKMEVDHAVGCAVKTMGPKLVLEAIPLNITGQGDDPDFPRSWLLPVLRENVMETELGFFTEYFLPLSAKLRQTALQLAEQENTVASKTYETLQLQIWSLLQGFCTKPTDLATSFRGIAKVLGTAISDREDLRLDIMAALRKIIKQSLDDDAAKAEVSKFAKNFLPILFNLYTADPVKEKDPVKLAVYETIKSYLQITDLQSVSTFCDKCLEKRKEDGATQYKSFALLDLAMAMLPYVQSDRVKKMFKMASKGLKDSDKKFQKKCYRILEEICSGKSESCSKFVKSHLSSIQKMMLDALSSSSPSSKAPRLRCLISVFQQLDKPQPDFILACVPEAILCTKEVAERARLAAFNLLVTMGNTAVKWSAHTEQDSLEEYFKMVMAGFAGSPTMISATLLALTRILYEFKGQISERLLGSIVDQLCVLLRSRAREVIQSALGFLKVLLSAYPVTSLATYLKDLVASLISMKEDCHHHFRFKSKEIYTKLIRKFGYETIYGMANENTRKVLANIQKTQKRAKKKKEQQLEEDEDGEEREYFKTQPESIDDLLKDSDTEMEEEEKPKAWRKGVKQKEGRKDGQAWLQEGGEEEIMDFMDPSASKQVMATKPVEKKKTKKDEGFFKTTPDGRLVITESSDEENGGGEEENDLDELLEALEKGRDTGKIKQKRKRKLEDLGSDEDDNSPPKYKAGGQGIHRPLKPEQKKQKTPTDPGSEYRAKKAKGDVKKKGKPDPYAYVPLNFQFLNKRKRAKAKGQFGNLVRGAKKGAVKGMKAKRKNKIT